MENTITDSKRTTLTPAEDLHFCECGKPADMSCTDAEQITLVDGDTWTEIWTESPLRYGCKAHPVQSMITFADGRRITAREYERGA